MDAELRLLFKDVLNSTKDVTEKKLLMNELRKIAPPDENRWNFRFVVLTLALIALSIPGYALWAIYIGLTPGNVPEIKIPEGLLSLGSAAIGALAAFLAPQRRKDGSLDKSDAHPTEPGPEAAEPGQGQGNVQASPDGQGGVPR